jgi:glycerophosphoryl diester phosphodiesterase
MQQAGLKVYTWTVNEPEDIQKMKEFGVDGIISDFPERVNP